MAMVLLRFYLFLFFLRITLTFFFHHNFEWVILKSEQVLSEIVVGFWLIGFWNVTN